CSSGRAASTRRSSAHEKRNRGPAHRASPSPCSSRARLRDRPPLPRQGPHPLRVLPAHVGLHAAARRHGRVLHVQGGQPAGEPAVCVARRRRLRDLVVDAVRLGRGDPVAALAGDAGGARLGADPVRARDRAADARDLGDRDLLARLHAVVGTARLRDPLPRRALGRVPRRGAGDDPRARPARLRVRLDLRPVPECERALEHARVAGAARHRHARAAVAAAGLGGADRVAARADLGRPGDSRGGDRRHSLAGRRDDDRARARVPGDRRGLPPPLRARGPAARDALVDLMRAFVRVFFIGGVIAYRGLFNWIRPAMYIPTMLIGPVFQILFFAYLGRYSKVEDDAFFVVGNAIQASAMSAVFAGTMTIANERQYQTLAPLLATPANRFAMFMGRAVPVIASGVLVSAWGFLMGWLLLDFDPPASSLPALAVIVVVSVTSCTAFGLTLGSIGMRARDVFMSANIAYYLMWLLCGVNIPLSALPDW